MNHALLALLAFPLMASAAPSSSFEKSCRDRLPAPQLTVVFEPAAPTFSQKYTVKELTARSKGPAWGQTLGQTDVKSLVEMKHGVTYLTNPRDGVSCVVPSLTLNISYVPMVVYVAKELAPGSCLYKEVLAHEMRHVSAYEAQRVWAKPQIEEFLLGVLAPGTMMMGKSDQVTADITRILEKEYMPWIQKLIDTEPAHAQIDTKEEYSRLSSVCSMDIRTWRSDRSR